MAFDGVNKSGITIQKVPAIDTNAISHGLLLPMIELAMPHANAALRFESLSYGRGLFKSRQRASNAVLGACV